jgi:hypothetical protein
MVRDVATFKCRSNLLVGPAAMQFFIYSYHRQIILCTLCALTSFRKKRIDYHRFLKEQARRHLRVFINQLNQGTRYNKTEEQ